VDAMDDKGIITIIAEGNKKEVSISIKDNGPGIPKEDMEKLFEPFYTTKTIGKGTGLGLSVSYGIVKMHSGKIMVESDTDITKGKTGTTFTVILPRRSKN
jgi:signal transduction histidine kinase